VSHLSLPLFSILSISIQRPRLEGLTESVSSNSTPPRSLPLSAMVKP
jgi:hypothetical protein